MIEYFAQENTSIDNRILALHLLPLGPPWPLNRDTVWAGVHRLSVGEELCIDAQGVREKRVWASIKACHSRVEVVEELRRALPRAVARLCAGEARVGVDCSGGLDSTVTAYLVRETGVSIDAYHRRASDSANEDYRWASMVMDSIADHTIIYAEASNSSFLADTFASSSNYLEGPFVWSAGASHIQSVASRNYANGIRVHFAGFGGDELFTPMPAQLWSCVRQKSLASMVALRRSARMNRVPVINIIKDAFDRRSFKEDFAKSIVSLSTDNNDIDLSWGVKICFPPWVSLGVIEGIQGRIDELVRDDIQPLSPDRAIHQALVSLSFESELLRQVTSRFGHNSVVWTSPYLNPSVALAALSVDSVSRLSDGHRKFMLKDATSGIVPSYYFNRRDKGEYSRELYKAIRIHRDRLYDFFSDCALADLGIVDADQLRNSILSGTIRADEIHSLQSTLEVERWIRDSRRVVSI